MDAKTSARVRGRRSAIPDDHQQALFIDLLKDGVRRDQAARAVGSTSSRFQGLQRRDRAFDDLVRAAIDEGRPEYQQTLRKTLDGIAMNARHPAQARVLITLAEAHLPEFEHKRVSRIGNVKGEELALGVNARITPEMLAGLSEDDLELLLRAKELERSLERGELRAIEGGAGGINEHG